MHIVLVITPILVALTLLIYLDPLNPIAAGGYSDDGYTHDAQVVIYNGPDTDYTGREIYIGSNEDEVVIVDVTDKNNPQHISSSYLFKFFLHPSRLDYRGL